MKYWVYKDARILGPFDKDAFAGLPGVDSATLVSVGESAASREGGWLPVGEISDLAGVVLNFGGSCSHDEPSSAYGLLDKLQIESTGLIGNDDFPGAAEDFFQDAARKNNSAELRRSKERVCELTSQLETLYKRVADLEYSKTDLMRCLAEKDVVPPLSPPPMPAVVAPQIEEPAIAEVLPLSSITPVQDPVPAPLQSALEAVQPTKASYPKALHFKVAPIIKSFHVASADVPIESKPSVAEDAEPVSVPVPLPTSACVAAPVPEPILLQFPVSVPIPAFVEVPVVAPPPPPPPAPAPVVKPVPEDMAGAAVAAPPATLSFAWGGEPEVSSAPPPSTQEVLARLSKPALDPQMAPPRSIRSNTPFLFAGAALVALLGVIGYFMLRQPKDLNQMVSLDDSREHLGAQPADDSVPTPAVEPKLAEMPTSSSASAVTPKPAGPSSGEQSSGSQPAAQAELETAEALVKDFPLDGGRETVAQWLQYSYNASPDVGQETWSTSATGDQGYLVEYRFIPTARNGADVHYLFAADMSMGMVFGKNLEAQRLLAGSAPRMVDEKPKAKPQTRRPAVKRAKKRVIVAETPNQVPLMPLPNEWELKPPAEDDAAFGADTPDSGL
ncbi:MAG: hypothetical protein AAB262_08715 [Elusimicrobiota bacterium]